MDPMLLLELHMMGAKVCLLAKFKKFILWKYAKHFPVVNKINNKDQLNEIYYKYKSKSKF